ncbi:hypothetical protein TorRG33x02_336190 [Trema orientale]|uniref:Uncharacterized protein n=1 Tax=Trema orientale TaxID=63057 RepID=A0A2P5B0E5_TREOI|nr:hypothetical protein TorRG33x02_336190 [Trema orientale]
MDCWKNCLRVVTSIFLFEAPVEKSLFQVSLSGSRNDYLNTRVNNRIFRASLAWYCYHIEKVSAQNSENRFKQLYLPAQRSSNMISQMKAKSNPETREPMSPIDYFATRHLKPSGWQNEYTQEKHAEMVMSRAGVLTQTQSRA